MIDGDARSAAIAAASVVAKVTRDRYMHQVAAAYPEFGFDGNVGYSTPEHRAAIIEHGPSAPSPPLLPLDRLLSQLRAGLAADGHVPTARRTVERTSSRAAKVLALDHAAARASRRSADDVEAQRAVARDVVAAARAARRARGERSFARLRGPTAIAGRLGPAAARRARAPSPRRRPAPRRRADQVDLAADPGGARVARDDPPARRARAASATSASAARPEVAGGRGHRG